MTIILLDHAYVESTRESRHAENVYSELWNKRKLECGPMPNVTAALPNIGGALCSTPQSLADTHCWHTIQ